MEWGRELGKEWSGDESWVKNEVGTRERVKNGVGTRAG